MADMMQVQLIRTAGGPEVFEAAELPKPAPGPGQVLVRQVATSVNPVDCKVRRHGPALGPALPAVLGCDVAGIVESVGPGVTAFAAGDAVYGCAGGVRGTPGALAQYIAADARLLARAPKSIPLREAAALPLVTITAWEGLFDRANLQPGQTVLVRGGTGGVGHIAIQLAKHRGAVVHATVADAHKAGIARSLGADATIEYKSEPFADGVARLTGGRGYDIVFDATGGPALPDAFVAARLNGSVVTIVANFTADLAQMHLKGLTLHAVFMLIPMLHDIGRERHGALLRDAAALVDAGKLRPLIDPARYTLARVADAHGQIEEGRALGKVVVDISPA